MKNIKSIIFNSESFKFDDSNYAKLNEENNFLDHQIISISGHADELTFRSDNLDINNLNDPDTKWGINEDGTMWNENGIGICDKNGKLLGHFKSSQFKDGTKYSFMRIYTNDNAIFYQITIQISPDGTPIAFAVTPPDNSSYNEIVTAQWVRNLLTRNGYILNS